ncbi:type IV pilus assembly protein FimV [Thauera sp. SDU_THAU2]|uniref:type IV pilus assembly protein FimV n=1 Tax=Thauera sp. SDU_THAU2 TaxID=3136633 RepID=UPI00311FE50C
MMKTSFKASLIALAIASIPLGSQAAGLGQINVFSGLGQPLRAEIQVNATAQELQSLTARIASPEAFQRASIAYSAAAAAIRVSVDTRASRPVVRLSSDRPINDPFVDLLVELDWANGRVAREYTFLLDPVDLTAPQPLAAAVDRPAAPAASSQVSARSAPPPAARVPVDAYTVRRGDTLNRIASANAQPGVTLDQMLVALYRANRNAFDGGNINRLRAGEVLAIPDADAARSIAPAEARREIRVHSADFDAYRRGLAAAAARRAPAQQAEAGQESAGRIVPRVEEPQAPADSGDQLRVSRSQPAEGSADANSRLQALEEELAARERALEEANARLAQLEASINDMKKLLELRSAPLAQLQQEAEGVPPAAEPPLSPVAAEAAAEPLLSAAAVDTPAAAEAPAAASDALAPADEAGRTEPAQRAETPTEAAGAEASAPEPTEAAEAAAVKDAPPAAAEEAAAPPPKRPVRRAPPPPPPPEPSFMESMMEDPSVIAGGGGILALLLGYAGLKLRNRRKATAAAPAPEALSELAPGGQSVFAATGGQSVDTAASSIMQTDFSQTGLSAIDADEGVDPVAEADVLHGVWPRRTGGGDSAGCAEGRSGAYRDPPQTAGNLCPAQGSAPVRDRRLRTVRTVRRPGQRLGEGSGDGPQAGCRQSPLCRKAERERSPDRDAAGRRGRRGGNCCGSERSRAGCSRGAGAGGQLQRRSRARSGAGAGFRTGVRAGLAGRSRFHQLPAHGAEPVADARHLDGAGRAEPARR